jgi:hypothetical protein
MSKNNGGLLSLVTNPIKALLAFIFVSALLLTLILPPAKAIDTIGAISITLYRAGGVVVGSIPPGIHAFQQGFTGMSEYQAPAVDWGNGASVVGKPCTDKKEC